MSRTKRPVVAINPSTGERKEFAGIYEACIFLGTGHANVRQALERNGMCCGWKIYDNKDSIRERINQLQKQLEELQ